MYLASGDFNCLIFGLFHFCSHFGFFNDNEEVVEMRDQKLYIQDLFGLLTLDKRGAITTYKVPGVHHIYWHKNQTVFDTCIQKWLT